VLGAFAGDHFISNCSLVLTTASRWGLQFCRLRKAKQLSQDVVALAISQLRVVRGGTKVILLDRGDGRAVPIAQRLSKYGVRQAFVVQGGFR
jgi:hypothetical protein